MNEILPSFLFISIEQLACLNIANAFCELKVSYRKLFALALATVLIETLSLKSFTSIITKLIYMYSLQTLLVHIAFNGKFFSKFFLC